ncbi:MAG: ribosome maturation factor RimP [Actinomycetota bacterium]
MTDESTGSTDDTPADGGFADASLSPVAARVWDLLAPVIPTADAELVDVDWTGGTLQVVIDHPDGIDIDRLAAVNRLISPILDQHDPVPGRYTLEVSSPGVERPLRRVDHYRRAVGETVIVKTVPGIEPRRVKGPLVSVIDGVLTVDVTEIDGVDLADTEARTVALADIASARTVFDWGPTPKKGGQGPKKKKKKQGGSARDVTDAASAGDPAGDDNRRVHDRKEADHE